jgi:hypothetical protein
VGPGATTASTGAFALSTETGLRVQGLARTGQGLSGPLSLAVVSIFLGALMLLAPRRGAVPAMAVPKAGAVGHPLGHTPARISASTVGEGHRRGVRSAPGAGQRTPRAQRPQEPAGHADTPSPAHGDLLEALERQLREADARLRAMYRSGWDSGAPDSDY